MRVSADGIGLREEVTYTYTHVQMQLAGAQQGRATAEGDTYTFPEKLTAPLRKATRPPRAQKSKGNRFFPFLLEHHSLVQR